MPFFKYKAKNKYGETISGKVEAIGRTQAAAELINRQLLIIELHPLTDDSFSAIKASLFGVKQTDIVNITRQLATMINAGLPLASGLSILVRQSKPQVAKLVASILQDIEGGSNFSSALSRYPKIFSRIYIQLVNAGETGGVLDQVLERLSDNLEKQKEFRGKTKGALIYPAIVILMMGVVTAVMMIFVVPKLTDMYKDFGAELPLATVALMSISAFFVNFWWLILIVLVGGIIFLRNWKKTSAGDHAIDKLLFKIPIFGELRKKIILTEFTRTLSLLLGSGVTLLECLGIVTESVESVIYRDALRETLSRVEKGSSLSESLSKYEEFPPILHQMMSVGEETGKLDELLIKLSKYFEAESEQAIRNLTTAIEPLIMVLLGIGVGAMVLAVIMPIYNLTSQF